MIAARILAELRTANRFDFAGLAIAAAGALFHPQLCALLEALR
jgi:hypothetical protein